ncbi:MAG: ABC transporter ATP-binding protein [Anaerolineales bacterium]|nr:ABC transporter ATP-binding protein [Anaerolineales bacterium]
MEEMENYVLQAQGLTKHYGDLTAVADLTLEVRPGEIFGFLGPNGAGKTTSINMICGLLKPDAGRVLVHGEVLDGGTAAVRARVGMCPQEIILWPRLTCIEQLQFIGEMYNIPAREARKRGAELLEMLGLSEKADKLARTLSGGMQRRLNLAMALVHDPDIVVLDEAEAGLDPQSRVLVREFIQALAQTKTVILTTHNMDEADRVADRVAIIDHGKLLVLDTPENLKQRVGAGDVVELAIEGGLDAQSAAELLTAQFENINVEAADHTLIVRALGIVRLLAGILDCLEGAGVETGEVRLRENTLEDVFIQLTGRRLRE